MATTLYLRDSAADTHLGADNATLVGANVGWTSKALSTTAPTGFSAVNATANTVTGATAGIEVKTPVGAVPIEWISPPVAADVTISGTITANTYGVESSMTANVAINVVIEVIRANATATRNSNTLVQIVKSARVTEMSTSTIAENFTMTPTSTAVNRGDRLRVRVFGDDAGTMATGFTFTLAYEASAAGFGESYVTFTENITFESAPMSITQDTHDSPLLIGQTAAEERRAQSFTAFGPIRSIQIYGRAQGAPTDNLVVELQSDSGGFPSGTVLASASKSGASIDAVTAVYHHFPISYSCVASTLYWIVARRSGALSSTDYFRWFYSGSGSVYAGGSGAVYDTGAWRAETFAGDFRFIVSDGTPIYLTDTASSVSTASVDKEAWTSRGSGVTSITTNTSTGWTAPVQATDTAGGTVVDWFTRPLAAVTLTGMAVLNIRALESNASANASLRCEIARVAGDGTSPTVWSSWCCAPTGTDNGELTTSEVARTINLSGDDLAISDGQRLRIRLYNEDSSAAAMVTGFNVQRFYNGTSGGSSGDSYITFPVTLSELGGGTTYTKAGYGKESG